MGFGGGIYTEQNKILPGAYFKFKSAGTTVDTYAERGLVGLITPSDWSDGNLLRLVVPELEFDHKGALVWPRDAEKAIGYDAYAPLPASYTGETDLAKWLPIFVRETFRNATGCFIYPLLGSTKAKASCTYATAAKYGERGNSLALKIDEEDDDTFTVYTLLDGVEVDQQNVADYDDLVANDWVVFDKSVELAATASTVFTGGISGTANAADVATAVETLGSYGVNVIVPMISLSTSAGYDAFLQQNNKYGHWMQMICDKDATWLPEGGHEYLIAPDLGSSNSLVNVELLFPWIAGAEAACKLGGTLDNRTYDGEIIDFLINTQGLKAPKQEELEYGMRAGYLMLHTVGTEWRVLNDDNTFITYTPQKDEAFHRNQTIRVLQTLANDWFQIFTNEFLGNSGTDESDRTNYKMRLVKSANYYQSLKAIKNFDSADITVSEGAQSDSWLVGFYAQPNFCVRKVYHEITVAPFNS